VCDRFVQFVLRHDGRGYFQFATLQSDAGCRQLSRLGLSQSDLRTVVLVEADGASLRSTATLRVCRRLTGLWPLLYAFIVVPKHWRDGVYSLVARNRKRWFKPPTECPVMPPEWRRRFVS
jgi:predicted DCC family thiol-disulfide oxidoreductase YuxK